MSFKGKILIFDLHNTLYDEVIEYGFAMKAALDSFGVPVDMAEVAKAHAHLGSDWHEEVWDHVEGVKFLDKKNASAVRAQVSRELTQKTAYKDTLDTIRQLKDEGARIFIATEATANAAADAVEWLGLDGIVEGVYSWPYNKGVRKLKHTQQRTFPNSLQKPHPAILGQILYDIAESDGKKVEPATLIVDTSIDVSSLKAKTNGIMARSAQEALEVRMKFENDVLKEYAQNTYYIGDSYFKDGFLAHNAGIKFIHAAYGKKVADQAEFEEAKKILYAVTGWEPYLLQLTQEAQKLPELTNLIRPFYVCKNSFREFVEAQHDGQTHR